jgi:hypothetical protein
MKMSVHQVDIRIRLSKVTLANYLRMVDALQWPVADLPLFIQEIAALEVIAEEHPDTVSTIATLVREWSALQRRVRAKLN